MSLIKIRNLSESMFMINALGLRLPGTGSGDNIVHIDENNLLNSEVAVLLKSGLVEIVTDKPAKKTVKKTTAKKSTKKKTTAKKSTKKKSTKKKSTKRKSKPKVRPEDVPNLKKSSVIVSNRDGELVEKKMVTDITGEKETIFIDEEAEDEDHEAFVDNNEGADDKDNDMIEI